MFSMISFQANGEVVEHAGQKPAFFGLFFNKNLVDYFTSLDAVRLAKERCNLVLVASENTAEFTLPARHSVSNIESSVLMPLAIENAVELNVAA